MSLKTFECKLKNGETISFETDHDKNEVNPFGEQFRSFLLSTGDVVHLVEDARLSDVEDDDCYFAKGCLASGIDCEDIEDQEFGNTVVIHWECLNGWEHMGDESDRCDWDEPWKVTGINERNRLAEIVLAY